MPAGPGPSTSRPMAEVPPTARSEPCGARSPSRGRIRIRASRFADAAAGRSADGCRIDGRGSRRRPALIREGMDSTPAGAPRPGRQRRAAPYAAAGLAWALASAAYLAGASGLLDPDALLAQRENLRSIAAAHPFLAMPAFMASYVAAMSLALPLGAVLGILAGLLFGLWLGTVLVVIAAAVSALAVFCLARSA